MAVHALSDNFAAFFSRLNPSPSFVRQAASEHGSVTRLIESAEGETALLAPQCFLQGSYKQDTAIYSINDIDIVVLCRLWQPATGSGGGRSWNRDAIFTAVARPLLDDGRYCNKVRFDHGSMCIKVDLGIKLEILPVVFKADNYDSSVEPFRLFRPETGQWEDGFARYHQGWLTAKNRQTGGNFIPAIKVFKHLRTRFGLSAVSFHLECLLFRLEDTLFAGGPADYVGNVLDHLASFSADTWYSHRVQTPCGDRDIFVASEWAHGDWYRFHESVTKWAGLASIAASARDRNAAVDAWQALLGEDFFPRQVSR